MNEATLPNNSEALRAIIQDLETAINAQRQLYEARIEYLEERIRLLTSELFRRSSEKRQHEPDSRQLHLFNEAQAVCPKEEPAQDNPLIVPEHIRRRPRRKPLPDHLPRVELIHDIPEKDKICSCGMALCCIGQEVSEKLDIEPATARVIRHIYLKYACKDGCQGVGDEGPTVKIAPHPPEIIPKGIPTAGTVAYVAISKYADALPLYRQEKIFARYGIEISRSTMASWMVMAADRCTPLMELLKEELISGPVVNADETPVQVMNEPDRKNTTQSYMWVFRGGDPKKPVILFWYSQTRSGDVPEEVLKGFGGYLQTDDFSAYERLEGQVLRVGCFAHTRRNFVKVVEDRGAKKKKNGSAEVALDYIGRLYKIEEYARNGGLSAEEIKKLRKEKAEPILREFKEWMEERTKLTPPKGLLGKALHYALSNWPKLIRYLEDGNISIDNNLAENAIRPFVVGRKNWLFAGHPNGAHAAATLYSLIETAKACGLEPYQYLRHIFEKVPYAQNKEDYRALLPQNLTAEKLAESSQ